MKPGNRRYRPKNSKRYGAQHQSFRRRLDPVVRLGNTPCARCGELIAPDEPWDLDHKDSGHGYLGPSHARCNRRDGLEKMALSIVGTNGNGAPVVDEAPTRWSRRWGGRDADPPVGTVVGLGDGMQEVYLGGGRWSEPVPRDAA